MPSGNTHNNALGNPREPDNPEGRNVAAAEEANLVNWFLLSTRINAKSAQAIQPAKSKLYLFQFLKEILLRPP